MTNAMHNEAANFRTFMQFCEGEGILVGSGDLDKFHRKYWKSRALEFGKSNGKYAQKNKDFCINESQNRKRSRSDPTVLQKEIFGTVSADDTPRTNNKKRKRNRYNWSP